MRRFDEWLLSVVERFCHEFQRWTRKTNFWLAKLACLPVMTTLAMEPLDYWLDVLPNRQSSGFGVLNAVSMITALWFLMAGLRTIEDPSVLATGTLPHWVGIIRLGRSRAGRGVVAFMGFTAVFGLVALHAAGAMGATVLPKHSCGPVEMLMSAGLVSLVLLPYLLEVNPLPPGTSKLSEWVKALTTRLVPAPVPVR